jgi:DNA-binding response OmpR family regulator
MRILLAEEERTLARVIMKLLESSNYSADAVYNGEDALTFLDTDSYDAVILDITMSKMDGLTVLKKIRAQGSMIPVLLLTAKSSVEDKVAGLDSGANYYLTKPFDGRELLAVIRAITRGQDCVSSKLTAGNLTLNRATFELSSPTGSFRLANKEFQMLELLMLNPNNVISADRFLEKIWGYDNETDISVVWVYISYLRKKLAALHATVQIKATRNVGYSLEVR